jgi:hypothetical protein
MAEFKVNASCLAKDGTNPKYEKTFAIDGQAAIQKRYGLTDAQFAQEAADNIARRITNGVRQMARDKGAEFSSEEADAYVNDWMPGRRATANPINTIKKLVNSANLTPEMAEQAEAIMARAQAELEASLAAMAEEGGD